ncbi:MAG TPA: (2Fe-2S)-binding protein [Spirochaetia bacterium]|nr:(2Fe-2S)-binding protein [Spirochaetia bacterium]
MDPASTLVVNGTSREVSASAETPLLYVLRNELGLNGPRYGCGVGQCGACTVLVDDRPVRSCTLPLSKADGHTITTLEGLGTADSPDPIQRAFIEEQAAQCGYCSNGMIMSAVALLKTKNSPSDQEIRRALDGNLCRCGSHLRILRAVRRASAIIAEAEA